MERNVKPWKLNQSEENTAVERKVNDSRTCVEKPVTEQFKCKKCDHMINSKQEMEKHNFLC